MIRIKPFPRFLKTMSVPQFENWILVTDFTLKEDSVLPCRVCNDLSLTAYMPADMPAEPIMSRVVRFGRQYDLIFGKCSKCSTVYWQSDYDYVWMIRAILEIVDGKSIEALIYWQQKMKDRVPLHSVEALIKERCPGIIKELLQGQFTDDFYYQCLNFTDS